jgi:hypothetical protein
MTRTLRVCALLLATGLGAASLTRGQGKAGRVEITVVDPATGKPVPCRIHLKDAAGKPQRPAGLPFWNDHFVCAGAAELDLPPGTYAIEIERGPEYQPHAGSFTLTDAGTKLAVELKRIADLPAEGWWPGDLHVHRAVGDVEQIMRAEDLHVAPVITWWNNRDAWERQKPPADPLVRFDRDRFYHVMAGEDEREGGALLYFHLKQPLAIAGSAREYPPPLRFVAEARKHAGVWVDAEKPFWWDFPTWVAAGQVDSVGLANNHMCRDRMYESEAWGKPRVIERLPAPLGNGYWTQEIYYHLLNCGLHIPPSAGSASGVLPNPVGYDRVYVHVGKELTWEGWWAGLQAGRSFVTNGPLLRVRAGGELPGHVFTAAEGKPLDVEVRGTLTTSDTVRFLEVVRDGAVERRVSREQFARTGTLGTLTFRSSGWFLVRVIADNAKTFRFASTAPYYVEYGPGPRRVSRASARFFLDWVRERAGPVKVDDAAKRDEVLTYHAAAEKFWRDVLARANAD